MMGWYKGVLGVAVMLWTDEAREGGREEWKCHMINKDRDGWDETRCMPRTDIMQLKLGSLGVDVTFWAFLSLALRTVGVEPTLYHRFIIFEYLA